MSWLPSIWACGLALAACGGGGDDAASPDAAVTIDAAAATFVLSSDALTEGASFAAANTCTGADTSPALSWSEGPTGTQSYAVDLTDRSIDLVHWVIFDVPATGAAPHTLPADVDKVFAPPDVAGAKQTTAYDSTTRGYLGPCPPTQHTYRFTVHALDVAALPGASEATSRAAAMQLIADHELGAATLTGTYTQP